jgi:hypothetical protein
MCLHFNSWSCLCQKCIIDGGIICTKVAIAIKVHRDICSYHCIPIPYLSIIYSIPDISYLKMLWYHNAYGIKTLESPIYQCWAGLTKWRYQPNTGTYSDSLGGTYRIIYTKWRVGLLYHRVLWRWLEWYKSYMLWDVSRSFLG